MNEKDKKSITMDELIAGKPVVEKPRSKIQQYFFDGKTPEEIKAWQKAAGRKRSETLKAKFAAKRALIEQARDLVPEVIAHDLMAEEIQKENWTPKQETIDKLKLLINKGLTVEEMRTKYFTGIKDDTWRRMMKFVFKSHTPDPESLGLRLELALEQSRLQILAQLKEIEQQIRLHKREKNTKLIPNWLLVMKQEREDKLLEVMQSVAKTLNEINAVGEKSKNPSVHIHVATPRPKKPEEPSIETESKVVA